MGVRGWRQGYVALVMGIALWGAVGVSVSAEMGSASPQVVNERAVDALSDAGKQETAEPMPTPTCPIEGPGGVMCTGPEVPNPPPDKQGKGESVYLPLLARQGG